ncbi:LysE family transporter [Oscillatoria sp. FACHB-1407]|uniref:LysE family translocator n=1 Tax=Oscillatoria sp. FACHB-1407 TaxID=2692847 RepID=UPI00168747F0|nr:LysE family transporter [Oscillatoria sp. FACHB-1407]MBD2459581.1 LysE family transporter [Oscillatoria sp. FACHB-1407]
MTLLTEWLTVLGVGCIAVMSPGPNFVMTLRNSLSHSRRAGIYTAIGLAVGDLIHIAYCLVGIGVLIAQSILLFNIIKWLGAIYLIYLGVQSLQANPNTAFSQVSTTSALHPIAAFRVGLLTCILNPKVTLFFLAFFTQLIHPSTPLAMQIFYGLTVAVIELVWFSIVALVVSQQVIKDRFLAISHWIERVTGVVLIGLGIRVAIAQDS